eukprot:m51a1_g5034 putative methyltransferase-like protein 14 homolog (431) ;mRNA; f:372070-373637
MQQQRRPNDYCQHYVDTGQRPQNYVRDAEVGRRFDEYPKLRELVAHKEALIAARATPPMALRCDLAALDLWGALGTKFDVVLIDPPWEEYASRCSDPSSSASSASSPSSSSPSYWSYDALRALEVERITETPSFLFLWCGSRQEQIAQGRALLKKWGFRRCEDICWLKTNRRMTALQRAAAEAAGGRGERGDLLHHSKEHCLMGIKGTVRRNKDGHLIHANIDTDVIIAEEPLPPGSTHKPPELYNHIEHFCLGRRRLELFGEDHNMRPGWVTLGASLAGSNYDPRLYRSWFAGDAGHLLGSTPHIEAMRPKSPPRPGSPCAQGSTSPAAAASSQQQQQQQQQGQGQQGPQGQQGQGVLPLMPMPMPLPLPLHMHMGVPLPMAPMAPMASMPLQMPLPLDYQQAAAAQHYALQFFQMGPPGSGSGGGGPQ